MNSLFEKLKHGETIHVVSTTSGVKFSVEAVTWAGNRVGYAFKDEQGQVIPGYRKMFSDEQIKDASQYWMEVSKMPTVEMRGYYQVTIFSDHEEWRLSYTNGTFSQPSEVTAESKFPECVGCHRWWSPQDRDIRFDDNGQMTCPYCQ